MSNLEATLDGLGRPRVLVLGDLVLDRYTRGNAERISQEAPVIVLRAHDQEVRPGGAANVAYMLRALESQVTCIGVTGEDEARRSLLDLLEAAGVDCSVALPDHDRPTTLKERFVGLAGTRHPSQILRVDREVCDPISPGLESQFIEQVVARLPDHDALLISDYSKGVCTPRVLRETIAAARHAGRFVAVDPARGCSFERYRGATLIKPNRIETELATGCKIATSEDARRAGHRLCRDLDLKMALITLDRDGMLLVDREGQGESFPTRARAVYDITGAGDMVLAMLGLCLAAGTSPADAVRLSNVAAGIEVERVGVSVVRRDEIRAELMATRHISQGKVVSLQEARRLRDVYTSQGRSVVFTNGCFDLLHVGHVRCLAEAAKFGDVLFVGVNSDQSVRRLKGPQRPVIGEADRAAMLAALACVQHVIVYEDDTPHALLEAIRPDVLVKGGTYTSDQVVGHEVVQAYGGRVCVTGVVDGISTTNILASLDKESRAALPLRKAG